MASARFAWGIDIGNRALKAVKLVREGEALRVDDFELIEHETVLSNSGDNREGFITSALTSFVQRHPIKGGSIAVGVSGQQSFARFIKLPPVESKKIPEIVRFEAIQQIPFPLDDVEWSYQLFQAPESPDVEVGIFAMRKELVNQHIKYFTDFDLNVQVVQMNPLAVYNAMHYDGRLASGTTMIIDLGAENTDLIIADKETIWMRSIPIGGNNFTQTLEKAFKLPFTKAEELKRNAATSKYARQIFQAMRPVFADLVAEIQRSIGFYASVHRDSRIRKIMALGGTFKLPGLQKYLQQNLQLDVERPDHIAGGAPADTKLASTFNENLLSVISAYGLAVQAMGEAKITSSLLPQRIRREKMWKEKTKWFAATAALFCLGTAIPLGSYVLHDRLYAANEDDRQQAAKVQGEASKLDTDWAAIETAGSTERAQIANLLQMADYRDLQRGILADINRALPKPQPPVLEGLRKVDPSLVKQVPRNKREVLLVDSISMKYEPNVTSYLTGNVNPVGTPGADQPGGGGAGMRGQQDGPGTGWGSGGGGQTPGAGDQFTDPGAAAAGAGHDPAAGQPTQPPPDAAAGAAPLRGYIVTIRGTSPHELALEELVTNKFVPALNAVKTNEKQPHRLYEFRNAKGIGVQLRDDANRLAKMKTDYEAAKRAREWGQRGGAPGAPGAPPAPGGPAATPTPGVGGNEQGMGGPREQAPPAGGPDGQPGQPPAAPADGALADPQAPPEPAFLDPLLGEDVRSDWDYTVTFVVVLDPPDFVPGAEPPAPGAAPAAPAASAR